MEGRYSIVLKGHNLEALITRLNAPEHALLALRQTREERKERRALRAHTPRTPKEKKQRALPGRLHHHFRNHPITWTDAVLLIARATRRNRNAIQKKLVSTLDIQGVASLRLKSGFVFRVDLPSSYRGLINSLAEVEIRTTDDNRHPAYRRFRMYTKRHLDLTSRARQSRNAHYATRITMRRTLKRVFG